jgi:hypothetical protein
MTTHAAQGYDLLFLFFVQDVTHIDRGYGPRIAIINVLSNGLPLAGFQVITYGRFWVITEDQGKFGLH